VNSPTDTTPLATKLVLIATLAVTAAALVTLLSSPSGAADPARIAPILWLFTALFVLRVTGQVIVALRPQRWLPPMEQWNLVPYAILLPTQLLFIAIMAWINESFAEVDRLAGAQNDTLGRFLIAFSTVYALSMVIRYVVTMGRRPERRWFGGTIPIVFHFVLAAYLYVLGSFYAAS
jgi:hypothetical protein